MMLFSPNEMATSYAAFPVARCKEDGGRVLLSPPPSPLEGSDKKPSALTPPPLDAKLDEALFPSSGSSEPLFEDHRKRKEGRANEGVKFRAVFHLLQRNPRLYLRAQRRYLERYASSRHRPAAPGSNERRGREPARAWPGDRDARRARLRRRKEDAHLSSPQLSRERPAKSTAVTASPEVNVVASFDLPDYSPPTGILDHLPRPLRTDWKGPPLDLSRDPNRHLLHLAEVQLASVLRLSCAVYLDSKRRIFVEKVARLKRGLPFLRTNAQQCTRIDVNKASRLWVAFDRVGWFDDKHFRQFL